MGEATLAGMRTEATLVARRGFMHDGDEYDVIAAVVTPYEDAIRRLSAALAEQQRLIDRQLGDCIGCTPQTGPEETCPRDGRSYTEWVEIASEVIGRHHADVDRAEAAEAALADLRAKVDAIWRWCESNLQGGAPPVVRAALAAAPSGEPNTEENR